MQRSSLFLVILLTSSALGAENPGGKEESESSTLLPCNGPSCLPATEPDFGGIDSDLAPKKSKIVKKDRLVEPEQPASAVVAKKGVGADPTSNEGEDEETTSVPKKGVEQPYLSKAGKSVPKKGVPELDSSTASVTSAALGTTTFAPEAAQTNASSTSESTNPSTSVASTTVHTKILLVDEPKSKPVTDPSTPDTSLLVGIVFGVLLLSVVVFLGVKRLRAAQRRREYRRMNDFLIDGMYNDL